MCGIIAVVGRRSDRRPPEPGTVRSLVETAVAGLDPEAVDPDTLAATVSSLSEADQLLRGVPGVRALLDSPGLLAALDASIDDLWTRIDHLEQLLDAGTTGLAGGALERVNAEVVRVKDAAWAIQRDRIRTARAVGELAGSNPSLAALEAGTAIQIALSALDRLEVRGRDSAGLHLLVRDHGLDLDAPDVRALLRGRADDALFRSGAVRTPEGHLSFVYKAAAEIGQLGDNGRALRAAIAGDELLRLALAGPDADVVVVGHTRWASVGIISQANAHPLNGEELPGAAELPYVIAALNGDVDNYADLKAAHGLRIPAEITTDAKVIPSLVGRRLADGADLVEAFRTTVASFEGSVAIIAQAAADPDRVVLAQRGSGQGLYVGLADDAYVVASEPYGLVEVTSRYVRMDGETPANPDNPTASRGQVLVLDRRRAGELDGIDVVAYDGTPVPLGADDVAVAQITTRDIDRGAHPHFLLKELGEAPGSFRKTLRGKLVDGADGRPAVLVGDEALPPALRDRLADGSITRVIAIGQGTAAVAAQSLASFLSGFVADTPLRVEAALATELSGFAMRTSMADTLVVAISQSGTTTDTNRTVDLARSRGAAVIAIVNRRNSDLTDKADGVLYTSDGRDVEMAVPSTKAFYAQVAA
ncbi:MAG: SIS domain-containing protein, partial [Actinomycetota bacterium]|nr:SIS domain-containing protein [Actinomycetota bacterium]